MKSEYFQIIFLMIVYNIICFLSLVFATGFGPSYNIGLNLDDNQFIAYVLICISLFISVGSLKVKDRKQRILMVKIMGILIALYLLLFLSGIVGANEAMFYFIIPIFGIPIFIFMFIFHYLTFNK